MFGGRRQVGPEHEARRPKKIGRQHHVHERSGDGDLDLVKGLLGQGLEPGEPAYGQEGYVRHLDAEALGHERVAELVQEHADEERDDDPDGDERR